MGLNHERSPLRAHRIRLGLTLEHAAQLTGGRVSRSGWARVESTGRATPETWGVIAAVLGVPVAVIRATGIPPAAAAAQPELPWEAGS